MGMRTITYTVDYYDRPQVTTTNRRRAIEAALDANARTVTRTVADFGRPVSECETPAEWVQADARNLA
jgi:hypothetical protein